MGHPPRARVNGKKSNGQPHHRVASIPIYLRNVYIYILYPCLVLFGIFCLCFLPLYRHCLLIFQNDLITIFSLLNPPLYWL